MEPGSECRSPLGTSRESFAKPVVITDDLARDVEIDRQANKGGKADQKEQKAGVTRLCPETDEHADDQACQGSPPIRNDASANYSPDAMISSLGVKRTDEDSKQ